MDNDPIEMFNVMNILERNESQVFEGVHEDAVKALMEIVEDRHYNLKWFWSANATTPRVGTLHITCPSPNHESGHGPMGLAMYDFNRVVSGSVCRPMKFTGRSNVCYPGIINAIADSSCTVQNREHDSPNLVYEVHYRNNTTYDKLRDKACSWISATNDVMFVVVVILMDHGGMFSFTVSRNVPPAAPGLAVDGFRSFGTARLHHATSAALQAVFPGAVFRGVGFHDPATLSADPPCNAESLPLYVLNVPGELLLARDVNAAPAFREPHAGPGPVPTLNLDLYVVQQQFLL